MSANNIEYFKVDKSVGFPHFHDDSGSVGFTYSGEKYILGAYDIPDDSEIVSIQNSGPADVIHGEIFDDSDDEDIQIIDWTFSDEVLYAEVKNIVTIKYRVPKDKKNSTGFDTVVYEMRKINSDDHGEVYIPFATWRGFFIDNKILDEYKIGVYVRYNDYGNEHAMIAIKQSDGSKLDVRKHFGLKPSERMRSYYP